MKAGTTPVVKDPKDLKELRQRLTARGVQPSAQRLAVAQYVLSTEDHPSADEIWQKVRARFPMISRATVYNTLTLFCDKGLLTALQLSPGRTVYDPKRERHHHFVDDGSGRVYDLPWDALGVSRIESLRGFDVRDYQVVVRGRRKRS